MDEATRQMHLKAGRAYGVEATCGKKIDYGSEESADKAAAAMTRKTGRELEAYPCDFCDGWHVGRAMAEEERSTFA